MKLYANKYTWEQAANKLTLYLLERGYKITKIHFYEDMHGKIEYCKIRMINQNDSSKKILPMHINAANYYELREPNYLKGKKPLYKLPEIIKTTDIIHVVEGEACADLLIDLGLLATTSGSCNSALSADWSVLSGKEIRIWPDSDAQGEKYAQDIANILLHLASKVSIINVKTLNLNDQEDCIQWYQQNPDATSADIIALPATNCELEKELCIANTKAGLLLELVKNLDFFHDEQKVTYASINEQDRNEVLRLDSEQFSNWLSHIYWNAYSETISSQTKDAAISTMHGKALYEGVCHRVFTRVGILNEEIYINLANEYGQVVTVSQQAWDILNISPIKFVKGNNMKPLPTPLTGGNIDLLWKYINIPKYTRILIVAWLLECLRPNTDFPILVLYGAYGSAKSTTQEFLCNLIDPSLVNLRGAPRNMDDIMVAAANSHIISYNNMSALSRLNQDDFCNLATGGGIGKRMLYKNREELLVEIKRPVIMNSINNIVTARDLISRSIVIELPEIPDHERKTGTQLQHEFIQDYPYILGGLYDLYVSVLKVLPEIQLTEKPRLADFALLGTALERVLNLEQETFIKSLQSNSQSNLLNSLELHPIFETLINFIVRERYFKGTFSELLDQLSNLRRKLSYDWPTSGHAFARLLKDYSSTLQKLGLRIYFDPCRSNRGKLIEINAMPELLN
ncbi:MAG: hypothetical protein ABSA84_03770 [Gammaproteobacteria bacterium]